MFKECFKGWANASRLIKNQNLNFKEKIDQSISNNSNTLNRWLIVVHIENYEETEADNVKIQMNVALIYLLAIYVVWFLFCFEYRIKRKNSVQDLEN